MVDVYKAPEAKLTKPFSEGEFGSIEIGTSGAYRFQIREVFAEAWKLVKGAKFSFFISGCLYFLTYVVVAFLSSFITTAFGLPTPDPLTGAIPEGGSAASAGLAQILSGLILTVLTTPLWAGLMAMGIKRSGNNKVSGGSIYSRYSYLVPLFFTTVIYYILVGIGFVLLILPGIYLSVAYVMAFPLVTEKGLGPWRALETSRKAITRKWFRFFGFSICLLLLLLISIIPLGIGLIWVAPFVMIALGIAYRNMFGLHREA